MELLRKHEFEYIDGKDPENFNLTDESSCPTYVSSEKVRLITGDTDRFLIDIDEAYLDSGMWDARYYNSHGRY